ncbi:MAG: hypothetical protein RR280_10460 [Bacteroidaceae bacterium]
MSNPPTKYQPHQIYTTIAEMSEAAAKPIRDFVLQHIHKGNVVSVYHKRMLVTTKEGQELELLFATSMSHFLANRYDEGVVLGFAKSLSDTIQQIPDSLTELDQTELFLKIRNSLKLEKSLYMRVRKFFEHYQPKVTTDKAYIAALGDAVADGLDSGKPSSCSGYGELLCRLGDLGYNHTSNVFEVVSTFALPSSFLAYWAEILRANHNSPVLKHNSGVLEKVISRVEGAEIDWIDPDSVYAHILINRLMVDSHRKPIYNFYKEFPLRAFDLIESEISDSIASNFDWAVVVRGFANALKMASYLSVVSSGKLHNTFKGLSKLVTSAHRAQVAKVWKLMGEQQKPTFSFKVTSNGDSTCFDYTISGSIVHGDSFVFKASQVGMFNFLQVYDVLVSSGLLEPQVINNGKVLNKPSFTFDKLIARATSSVSWIAPAPHLKALSVYKGDAYACEQYYLAEKYGYTNFDTWATKPVPQFSYWSAALEKLMKSQGFSLSDYPYNLLIAGNDADAPMSTHLLFPEPVIVGWDLGSSPVLGSEEPPMKVKLPYDISDTVLSNPFPKLTLPKGAGKTTTDNVVGNSFNFFHSKEAVEKVEAAFKDAVLPALDITPLNTHEACVINGQDCFSINTGGSLLSVEPPLLGLVGSVGASSNGKGYRVLCKQTHPDFVSYVAARYSSEAKVLSVRLVHPKDVETAPLKTASELGFTATPRHYSVHLGIQDLSLAVKVTNLIIQAFCKANVPTKFAVLV